MVRVECDCVIVGDYVALVGNLATPLHETVHRTLSRSTQSSPTNKLFYDVQQVHVLYVQFKLLEHIFLKFPSALKC